MPRPISMKKSIAASSGMIASQEIGCFVKTKDGFAISLIDEIIFLDRRCQVISKHPYDGLIVAMNDTDIGTIVVNTKGDIDVFGTDQMENIFSGEECNVSSFSGDKIFISQENNEILAIYNTGEYGFSSPIDEPDIIHVSDDGNSIAVASKGGALTIFGPNLETFHHSPPRDDDVEVISVICPNSKGRLLVSRSSLGLVVDERAVNRIELWDIKKGLIMEAEVPSRITCIAPSQNGYVAGCFEGEVILIEQDLRVSTISKSEYSISDILEWEGDIIASCWFFVERINQSGTKIWSFEHQNLVKGMLRIDDGGIVVFGKGGAGNAGNHISLILPDAVTQEDITSSKSDSVATELSDHKHSGMLSENESSAASRRASLDGIEDLISEILEPIEDTEYEKEGHNGDLLESLASSARSLNIPPVANPGEDITVSSNEDSKVDVILNGSDSYDPDGEIVSWSWSTGSGRNLGQSKIVRVRLAPGVHVFTLRVTDNMGAESESSMTVRVTD